MNRDADDSGFCVSIGVFGADPRRHAFSYDVSASRRGKFATSIKDFSEIKLFTAIFETFELLSSSKTIKI